MSLLNDSLMEIQNLDEENIQITAEKEAYQELYEEAVDEIKYLNTKLDEYEPREITGDAVKYMEMRSNNEEFNKRKFEKKNK